MAATWAFIPPTVIRNAWITERAEVYAIAGTAESAVYGRTLDDLEKSLAPDFRGFFIDAKSTGQGPFGSADFSAWGRDRIVATWLWIGLVAYRLHDRRHRLRLVAVGEQSAETALRDVPSRGRYGCGVTAGRRRRIAARSCCLDHDLVIVVAKQRGF
ncbi:MAG: hypothetical protein DVS81_14985 [Candidatus Accumulibacter meliphilus]|jgi:hypothetical protein|uniref:Uncharacterized protein n=1 Tax=Candidatus Accumulibacter meliphilus TaxID=2211374 RepID=A0A369XI11_9PROT|nr:MAG: hypothetical protein DVS81_14985 [Candidatus Accumulibacter meliphilus]